jgi:hypothetical protein
MLFLFNGASEPKLTTCFASIYMLISLLTLCIPATLHIFFYWSCLTTVTLIASTRTLLLYCRHCLPVDSRFTSPKVRKGTHDILAGHASVKFKTCPSQTTSSILFASSAPSRPGTNEKREITKYKNE